MSFLTRKQSIDQSKAAIRPSGATVTAGGLGISSVTSFITSSASFVDTGINLTIDTLGNPVAIAIVPINASGGSVSAVRATTNGLFQLLRDATVIATTQINENSTLQNALFLFFDIPAAGTHVYSLQVRVPSGGSDTVSIANCNLIALELG